jgi:hypothetical protein
MLEIEVDDREMLAGLEFGELETSIFNDARSAEPYSFPYFFPVDLGRKGFSAKNAKALRFEVGGRVIFRKSVGPSMPRNIRLNSFAQFYGSCINAAASVGDQPTVRAWLAAFLTKVAWYHAQTLADLTPKVSGKLAQSYRPTIAI